MSGNINAFIITHLHDRVPLAVIVSLVTQVYNVTLTESDLYKYHNKVVYTMLDDTTTTHYGSRIDKLIKRFINNRYVRFMYVMHVVDYGVVIYR